MHGLLESFARFGASTGFAAFTWGHGVMLCIAGMLLYLAIVKKFEPLLLLPIGFGMLLANLPIGGLMDAPRDGALGGLLWYLYQGVKLGIYPPLIFLGIGAMTDFGPLLANPKTLLLGAAAQLGIFTTFMGALALGFNPCESSSIGIIGGADGPTAIFLTARLAPHLLGAVAIAAYSYMALVPIIQPPIMKLLTTARERATPMAQLREVSQREKIIFPVAATILVCLLVPGGRAAGRHADAGQSAPRVRRNRASEPDGPA